MKKNMGRSFSVCPMHIVFSTKYRQPLIHPPVAVELHSYMAAICNNLGCPAIIVGGYTDHVHILCFLSKKVALMTLLEKVKSHSSKWIKTKGNGYQNFFWQEGYAAFAVNRDGIDRVKNYISSQHQHHNRNKFEDEYRELLIKHKVEFDEMHIWD